MSKNKDKQKKFKVYYFVGDFFSSEGENRRYTIILADSESDAEYIFKRSFTNYNFGWIEEI